MNKFRWGGVNTPGIYLDENVVRMCKSYRMVLFGKLAAVLLQEGKNEQALQVLDKCMEVLPPENVPMDYSALSIGESYYRLGAKEKGHKVFAVIAENMMRNLNWYFRLTPQQFASVMDDISTDLYTMQQILRVAKENDPELSAAYQEEFDSYKIAFSSLQKE